MNIPSSPMLDFLVELLNIPSPTGYHQEAVAYTQAALAALDLPGAKLSLSPKGALLLFWPGQDSAQVRGVTAHVDTLGAMVKEIKDNGRLKLTQLGGWMWNSIEGENVSIQTAIGARYRGTVLLSNTSTHVNPEASKDPRSPQTMEVRIDAKTQTAADTRALGIAVGDFVFFDPRVEVNNGFIRSRHLDDKAGVAALYGALLGMKEAGLRPAFDTYCHISNYEEVGHGGAGAFPQALDELLAIDMGAMGPGQQSDEFSVSICVKDASGPYHYQMNRKLRRLAAQYEIPAQVDIYPQYSSDGSAYWRAGGQARVGLIGPGVDASHAYERTHTESLTATAQLLARYLEDASA